MIDGEIAGVWRARTKPPRLEIAIEPFRSMPQSAKDAIEAEAALTAPFRDCDRVQISYRPSGDGPN